MRPAPAGCTIRRFVTKRLDRFSLLPRVVHTILLIYTWLVRVLTCWLPDAPLIMRFRGWAYSLGMKRCGHNLQVAHDVVLTAIESLELGSGVYFANGCVVLGGGRIAIGDNVLFGPMNLVASSNHSFDGFNFKGEGITGSVIVDANSWVGGHCALLVGTHVHPASLVGAGSVCNRNFAEGGVLIAGNPARVIKRLAATVEPRSNV